MKYYRLHHNGTQTTLFDSYFDCTKEIADIVHKHDDLRPVNIFNYVNLNLTVIIYKYWTNYCEMFMIEEIEK